LSQALLVKMSDQRSHDIYAGHGAIPNLAEFFRRLRPHKRSRSALRSILQAGIGHLPTPCWPLSHISGAVDGSSQAQLKPRRAWLAVHRAACEHLRPRRDLRRRAGGLIASSAASRGSPVQIRRCQCAAAWLPRHLRIFVEVHRDGLKDASMGLSGHLPRIQDGRQTCRNFAPESTTYNSALAIYWR